jgi:hypothetical protein
LYIQCKRLTCPAIRANDVIIRPEKEAGLIDIGEFAVGENDDSLHDFEPRQNKKSSEGGGWLLLKRLCSLRQYDLDQVLRVERGSLLSVPRRGTPRSVVYKYTLIFQAVNLMKNERRHPTGMLRKGRRLEQKGGLDEG